MSFEQNIFFSKKQDCGSTSCFLSAEVTALAAEQYLTKKKKKLKLDQS